VLCLRHATAWPRPEAQGPRRSTTGVSARHRRSKVYQTESTRGLDIANLKHRRHNIPFALGNRMITVPELAAEALGSYLTSHLSRRFGSTHADLTELIPSAARLSLECIGNSDALYHNVEHTMLVTLVGYDIMKDDRSLYPRPPAISSSRSTRITSNTWCWCGTTATTTIGARNHSRWSTRACSHHQQRHDGDRRQDPASNFGRPWSNTRRRRRASSAAGSSPRRRHL